MFILAAVYEKLLHYLLIFGAHKYGITGIVKFLKTNGMYFLGPFVFPIDSRRGLSKTRLHSSRGLQTCVSKTYIGRNVS